MKYRRSEAESEIIMSRENVECAVGKACPHDFTEQHVYSMMTVMTVDIYILQRTIEDALGIQINANQ
jgi:hypothetical protein